MKKFILWIAISVIFSNCTNNKAEVEQQPEISYAKFGAEITPDKAINKAEMSEMFKSLKEGDTVSVKFKSNIIDVCQKKGCWMNLDLGNNQETMVRFRDYGFFVPKNAANAEAIVEGSAFLSVTSIDELKHYAKDAGKTDEEIASITEPETKLSIIADGVLIQNISQSTEGDNSKSEQ
ncbi:MAG: DUF4920 domain-containing protein [Bacteroidia bacterium]|nr:DUF4920 domain-containing protein [Bacteroidia bacterium]MCZ2249566.1 DUF4920 domain-containing protein [Bacteroidia bacterium]